MSMQKYAASSKVVADSLLAGPARRRFCTHHHKKDAHEEVTEEAVGEQWFAVGGDDDRWWSEATTKGVGRPQTATASQRQWRRDWWEEAVDATVRCEAAVDAAAVRAVEGDNDGDGFGGGGETGSEEDEGRRCGDSESALHDGGESVREKKQGVRGERSG
ncbi:hypothetical protein Scep_007249 [Stephania cephalantha]|uniref:Uncharacterized protein n=1 Tax=Stephania cephalantha TaxID=152367 RepID=A0AAP0PLL6_9MAGN